MNNDINLSNIWQFDCYDKDGNIRWSVVKKNRVVNEGLSEVINMVFLAASNSWYVGLKNSGAVSAVDTMGSHSGWSENAGYNQTNRVPLVVAAPVDGATDNSANRAEFSINLNGTIAGAFITSDNTKNGTSGKLYGAVDFGAARSVIAGDTLQVAISLSVNNA